MANVLSWFEIPVSDFDRAVTFYNSVFQIDLEVSDVFGYPTAFFPNEGQGVTGALMYTEIHKPTSKAEGTVVYFAAPQGIRTVLERVVAAGGEIVVDRSTHGAGLGYYGVFKDSEGNIIGLHNNT